MGSGGGYKRGGAGEYYNLNLNTMQIKYWGNLQQPVDAMQKVSAIAWSQNGKRHAVAASDRVIHLYDD